MMGVWNKLESRKSSCFVILFSNSDNLEVSQTLISDDQHICPSVLILCLGVLLIRHSSWKEEPFSVDWGPLDSFMDHVPWVLDTGGSTDTDENVLPVDMMDGSSSRDMFHPHWMIVYIFSVSSCPFFSQSSDNQFSIFYCHPLSLQSLDNVSWSVVQKNPWNRLKDKRVKQPSESRVDISTCSWEQIVASGIGVTNSFSSHHVSRCSWIELLLTTMTVHVISQSSTVRVALGAIFTDVWLGTDIVVHSEWMLRLVSFGDKRWLWKILLSDGNDLFLADKDGCGLEIKTSLRF
ncbi:hypothetical protein GCK72_024808 [Caenorhabditis remanei]|uniref:Uncharacterized protein n=1 Tax=Caenorhabditis remanei TaxID=31234 RepID=A0A6A5G0R0_CAERE|nr:hypothetical protein GCK72_024808 [Caenorhabditis remanei]KAF1748341.1 hypothetical protein GCK72_024808 [Caenorhabditis remanei]